MNPLDFPLLADENIHPEVIHFLREQGKDVLSVVEAGLTGQSDEAVLQEAQSAGRVVLTHDSDFGSLVLAQREPVTGIVYLRPGHIRPEFTTETLTAIAAQSLDVHPPFIVVGRRTRQTVQVRVRQL